MSISRSVVIQLSEPASKKDAKKRILFVVHTPLKEHGEFRVRFKNLSGHLETRKGRYKRSEGDTAFSFFSGDGEDGNGKVTVTCYSFNGDLRQGSGLYESTSRLLVIDWSISSENFG